MNHDDFVVDSPVGPTVKRVIAYRTAMANDALAPPCDMEAMQMRPERS